MIRTDLGCETLAKGKIVTPMLGFGNACTDIKKQKQEQFKKKNKKRFGLVSFFCEEWSHISIDKEKWNLNEWWQYFMIRRYSQNMSVGE